MAITVHVNVVSAEESVFSGLAEFVVLPGERGELGILPGHAPLMTRIRPGEVRIRVPGGAIETIVVAGGLLEVQPSLVTVLADVAIRAKDIDEAKAIEAKRRAEEDMKNARDKIDFKRAELEFTLMAVELSSLHRLRKNRDRNIY